MSLFYEFRNLSKAVKAERDVPNAFGESAESHEVIRFWFRWFKNGNESIGDD